MYALDIKRKKFNENISNAFSVEYVNFGRFTHNLEVESCSVVANFPKEEITKEYLDALQKYSDDNKCTIIANRTVAHLSWGEGFISSQIGSKDMPSTLCTQGPGGLSIVISPHKPPRFADTPGDVSTNNEYANLPHDHATNYVYDKQRDAGLFSAESSPERVDLSGIMKKPTEYWFPEETQYQKDLYIKCYSAVLKFTEKYLAKRK